MKAECQRIDAFELWCWRRLLRALGTERRSKQSILKGINTEYSLEGLTLKLKLQYFGHLMWKPNSLEKTLMLGKTEAGKVATENEMIGWHYNPMDMSLSTFREIVRDREVWHTAVFEIAKIQTWLNNWKTNIGVHSCPFFRGSSQPRDWIHVSCISSRFFTSWASKEAQEYWSG